MGHDIGAQIAYSYAAAHPTEVKRLVVSDLTFPGFAPPGRTAPWWFAFHQCVISILGRSYKPGSTINRAIVSYQRSLVLRTNNLGVITEKEQFLLVNILSEKVNLPKVG